MSRCKNLSAVDGIPFKSLNEFMNVPTPESAAALNGGSTTLYNVFRDISVVL